MRFSTEIAAAGLAATVLVLGAAGCERGTGRLRPAPPNTDPIVFSDGFGDGVDYQAFLGSKLDALSITANERFEGSVSLELTVPSAGDPAGGYAGGTLVTDRARELAGYDALTFWAKSSVPSTLDIAGLGNDNTGTSRFTAWWLDIPLTPTWTKFVIPVPLAEKLTSERGLFFFAEGPEGPEGHTVWFDEVKFENVGTISNPRPTMGTRTVGAFAGATVTVGDTETTFEVDGTDQTIGHLPGYFTFFSSNEEVATASDGTIRVVGAGAAVITAKLGEVDVSGSLTVQASSAPSAPAPPPTVPPADVISLFSNVYTDVVVDTWLTDWSRDFASLTEFQIAGDDVKAYTNLVFAGIEFASQPIDASAMTHFHMDVWVPAGTTLFKIKLVDFGEDGAFGGLPDSERELSFTPVSTPPLETATWAALEIPLENFMGPGGLVSRAHLAQLIISGAGITAFVDNVYFHK